MKSLSLFIAFLFLAGTTTAQPEGWVEIPSDVHLDARNWNKAFEPPPSSGDTVVVPYTVSGDCHVQSAAKTFRVDRERKYIVVINQIYGGCRAGGHKRGWVAFRKERQDYAVHSVTVSVDRIHNRVGDGFQYPTPPSTKTRKPLSVSEVDLKRCLRLDGQSRWIIQSEDRLLESIDSEAAQIPCRSHLESLRIDFDRYTLVGWSFASGYCEHPKGLVLSAEMELSSDPSENRYIINARYDEVDDDYCKTWTTFPVWILVPKLPALYRVDFTRNSKSDT